jgi:hypothetical protein
MANRPFYKAARAFMIWRLGKSVDWQCTYTDISQATGINYGLVQQICKERGWVCQFKDEFGTIQHHNGERLNYGKDVLTFMQERLDRRSSHV